jgi:hypothetical protein
MDQVHSIRMPGFRSKATLRICGDALVPDDVTRLFECPPTRSEARVTSDQAKASPEALPAPAAGVSRPVIAIRGISKGRSPNLFAAQCLTCGLEGIWRSLRHRLFVGLFITRDNEGIILSLQTLATFSERHIRLSLDIYGPNRDD